MTMQNEKQPTLDDVLNEFVAAHDEPRAVALDSWVARYPQFQEELIDFVAAWLEEALLPPPPALSSDVEKRITDRAMSHVLNTSFERDEAREARESTSAPTKSAIASLTGEARRVGLSALELAKCCGLDLALVTKLNNRQITPDSIPPHLVSQMARQIGKTVEAVADYLAGPPQQLSGMAFLARGKPRGAQQQSFADAVRASSLREAEKARWLDEAAGLEEH